MPPQHKALLIGASEYDDPRILDLPFVPDDLQRMRDALVERGFQSAEIVESKRGITPNTVNSRIRTFLRDADRGDTLFILLSGHGQHFKGSDYLIPEDATFDVEVFAETCIEIGWERELEESHATHVVFLVGACREGIDLDTMAPPGLKQWSQRKVADALRRKVAYVYACTAPQRARFVRPNDELRPGCEVGTRPGESFSLFSRAVADTICADPHALHLHDFFERVQQRVTDLHRAYGKEGAVQVITVRADTTPGSGNFPLLPGPERQPEAHPWIRAVEKHPVWQRTPDGSARQLLQQACVVLAGGWPRRTRRRPAPCTTTPGTTANWPAARTTGSASSPAAWPPVSRCPRPRPRSPSSFPSSNRPSGPRRRPSASACSPATRVSRAPTTAASASSPGASRG